MAQKRLNARRFTKRQVQELISSGARPRPDLSAALASTLQRPLVYELAGDRYLLVFGEQASGLAGKGDIYAADDFHRFVRWTAKVEADAKQGRQGSVGHWAYYSALKDRLIVNFDALIAELRSTMARTKDDLDFSYRSLDVVSTYVEGIGHSQSPVCHGADYLSVLHRKTTRHRAAGGFALRNLPDPLHRGSVGIGSIQSMSGALI